MDTSGKGDDGWWLASDGNWYPPTMSPGRRVRPLVGGAVCVLVAAAGVAAWARFGGQQTDDAVARVTVPVLDDRPADDRPGEDESVDDAAADPASDVELTSRDYSIGACVTWEAEAGYQASSVVDCAQPHRIEISGVIELDADEYPTEAEWEAVRRESCRALNEELLGRPLDPHGRVWASSIHPTAQTWRWGGRTVWCGVGARDRDGLDWSGDATSTGSVVGVDQSNVYAAGTCLRTGATHAVACEDLHDHEVTGTIQLPEGVSLPAPADHAGWLGLVGEECERVATEVLGGPVPDGFGAGWLTMEQASYEAGSRSINCIVGRVDGTGFVPSTGPVPRP